MSAKLSRKITSALTSTAGIDNDHSHMAETDVKVWDWKLDYWSLDSRQEVSVIMQALECWSCLNHLRVDNDTLLRFISEVKATYRDNQYHNFQHALSTVHFSFKLLDEAGIAKVMDKQELFAIIIGALCHDCDHRGRNNAFEIATNSELALRYNDRSPLENHHCAVAFETALSSSKKCNIFKEMDDATYRRIRQRMTTGILGTDMQLHNHHVQKLQSFATQGELQQDLESVVSIFLHAADIGNPMMPPEISARWGKAIAAEFVAQSEAEKKLGLPLTTMLIGLDDPKKAAKSQLGFIDFVFSPLAKPLFALCPLLEQASQFAEENREITQRSME